MEMFHSNSFVTGFMHAFSLFTISFREITSIGVGSKVKEKLSSLKRLLLLSSLEIEDLDGEGKAGSKKDSESNYCTSCIRQVIMPVSKKPVDIVFYHFTFFQHLSRFSIL